MPRAAWALVAVVALIGAVAWGCVQVNTLRANFTQWARSPEGREVLKPLATAGAGMATAEARQTAIAPTLQAQSTVAVATSRAQGTTVAATVQASGTSAAATSTARAVTPTPTPPPPTG